MQILGIDIGGSAIKGAPVDVETGALTAERFRIEVPKKPKPEHVLDCTVELIEHFQWQGPVGCTFPAIVKNGVTLSAANVDREWIGYKTQKMLAKKTHLPILLINDADAAGIAEMEFGAGLGEKGTVIMLTLGTGIGSAVFLDGKLLPNTELGHLEIRGKDAEDRAAARVKTEKKLSWAQWAERLNEYLARVDLMLSPDLYIIGGGVSKSHEDFIPLLKSSARIMPAKLFNDAGIVGAAFAARELVK
ncbi:MAG: ROK family protein [Anaerolineae bacterium]